MSIGCRFGPGDCGETAHIHIAPLEFRPAPLICEVRNVRTGRGAASMGKFRRQNKDIVIDCEEVTSRETPPPGRSSILKGRRSNNSGCDSPKVLEIAHLTAFLSRKASDLGADALAGHRSTASGHTANVSHRLGKQSPPRPSAPR